VSVEISILGPIQATRAGRPVDLGGPQQRWLLALLALRAGTLVATRTLVDELWPDGPPRTAAKTVQTYVWRLRRELGEELIERRGAGYALHTQVGALDLLRFEDLLGRGRIREALAVWRGPPLADIADLPGARLEADRLEERRLRALEKLLDDEVNDGRHAESLEQLQTLVSAHPLRERPRSLLMLALYRCGRQADALATYREARTLLVEQLGIEPAEPLRQLEGAILRHDPALATPAGTITAGTRRGAILVWRSGDGPLEPLVALAGRLAGGREVIVADLVSPGSDLRPATAALDSARRAAAASGLAMRTVAFTSSSPGTDAARLAREQGADLAIVACPNALREAGVISPPLTQALREAPCDVAVAALDDGPLTGPLAGPIAVPFGAAEHDWAAVELAAWIATTTGARLQLVGSNGAAGVRDASRVLATASLLLQRHLGIAAEPLLAQPGADGINAAVEAAGLVVAGIGDGWSQEGIGDARSALLREAVPPVILVRRGERPGGLAPPGTLTRYSWSRSR
jgi:DNA-binding SARP family transcriptional activator